MKTFSDFDGLALFVRIAEAGSLMAAERAVGIPKATLSRRLTALETTLNVRLARRTQKGVVLTEDGQRLYERTRSAFATAERAVAEAQDEATALTGRLRLSLPPDIATAVLAPALIRFQVAHPEVAIEMTLADRRVSLIEEGFDLVVRMGALADSGLISRRIASLERGLVASPAFLEARPDIQTPADLARSPALAIRHDPVEWEVERPDGQKERLQPRVVFSANRQTILVEAAVAGLGVANLPEFLISEALQSGGLIRVLPDWRPSPVEMTALWQRDRISGRLVKAIVEAFVVAFEPAAARL